MLPDSNTIYDPPSVWKYGGLEHMQCSLSSPWYKTMFQLSSCIQRAAYEYFLNSGLDAVLTPYTCGAVSSPIGLGSDSQPVSVELFGRKIYLADSMQFHLELLLRHADRGVFYTMPSIRGEDPDKRHLNEFFHIEAELCCSFSKILIFVEQFLYYIVEKISMNCGDNLKKAGIDNSHIEKFLKTDSLPKLRLSEVLHEFGSDSKFFSYVDEVPVGLSAEGETELLKRMGPVWVTHMHPLGTPFYQAEENSEEALAADLLLGIGEVIGCGERKVSSEAIEKDLVRRGIDPTSYQWYLSMKDSFPLQSSGFGLGLERFLLWILKHDDIRDIAFFNRLKNVRYQC